MPPPPDNRKEAWEYYKIKFLPDGYPGRQNGTDVVPHPLYGAYVVTDYLAEYRKTSDERYLAAAKTVADAAIGRMENLHGALVFYYQPDSLSSWPGKWYSGLTQARYLTVFEAVAKATGEKKYTDAAERVLTSLTLPTDTGGVARPFRGGIVIEEWANPQIEDYTLNGWTTALLMVDQYAADSGSSVAKDLFDNNVIALKQLLPLYDVPELANSRYRLTGNTAARLTFVGTTAKLDAGSVEAPGQVASVIARGTDNKWFSHVRSESPTEALLNVMFNYSTFPLENVLKLDIAAQQAGTMKVEVETGTFNPPLDDIVGRKWVVLADLDIKAGKNTFSVKVPWEHVSFAARATTFRRVVGGKRYNAYHFIHIKNLKALAKRTGEPLFAEYAEKWEGYVKQWPQMPMYRDTGVELQPK